MWWYQPFIVYQLATNVTACSSGNALSPLRRCTNATLKPLTRSRRCCYNNFWGGFFQQNFAPDNVVSCSRMSCIHYYSGANKKSTTELLHWFQDLLFGVVHNTCALTQPTDGRRRQRLKSTRVVQARRQYFCNDRSNVTDLVAGWSVTYKIILSSRVHNI